MSKDLDFIQPREWSGTIDDQVVHIRPLTVQEIPGVIRAVEPFLDVLLAGWDQLDAGRLVGLMGNYGEGVIEAVAICTRQPREWVGARHFDRLAVMALASVEINQDFFSQALAMLRQQAPVLAPTLAAKLARPASAGTKPSTA